MVVRSDFFNLILILYNGAKTMMFYKAHSNSTNLKFLVLGIYFSTLSSFSVSADYINLFNFENEFSQSAIYVTYSTLDDMLNDTNRLDSYNPDNFGAGQNVIGSFATIVDQTDPVGTIPEPSLISLFGLGLLMLIRSKPSRNIP